MLPHDEEGAAAKAKRTTVDEFKRQIRDLEIRLENLQNLQDKSRDDWDEIHWLRDELERLIGVVRIIAPPGTISTFTPGKRDANTKSHVKRQGLIFPGSGGQGNHEDCPSLDQAASILDRLLNAIDRGRVPNWAESISVQAFEAFLDTCDMGIEELRDREGIVIAVFRRSDRQRSRGHPWKRDVATGEQLDVTGLQSAHDALVDTLGGATPSIATWMVLKQIEAELEAHAPVSKRQSGGVIAIGQGACQLADILALKAALAALSVAYGSNRATLPPSVFLIEQVIVSALQICHQDVPGWTSITPGNPQPGSPIIPERPIPGGSMIPERPVPGGSTITPEQPSEGGRIIPDRPSDGGRIIPDRPGEGGSIKPSD